MYANLQNTEFYSALSQLKDELVNRKVVVAQKTVNAANQQ